MHYIPPAIQDDLQARGKLGFAEDLSTIVKEAGDPLKRGSGGGVTPSLAVDASSLVHRRSGTKRKFAEADSAVLPFSVMQGECASFDKAP